MPRIALTSRFCQSPQRVPVKGRTDFHDAIAPGLALRVTAKGHRSFVLVARFPGSENPTRRLLGRFMPEPKASPGGTTVSSDEAAVVLEGKVLTLEEARQKARIWLALIQKGLDPGIEAERQRAAALWVQRHTFGSVAEEFLRRAVKGPAYCELERLAAETLPSLKASAALRRVMADPAHSELVARSRREGLVKKAEHDSRCRPFIKRWGRRPIGDIRGEDVAAAIREIADRGAPEQARSVFESLRRLFNWAVGTNEVGLTASPMVGLRPTDLIGRKNIKDRILNDDELRAVWAAADKIGHPYGPTVKMLVLSGQRLREVAEAPWSEFDLARAVWTIDGSRMKGDHGAQLVPLARDAVALLGGIPRFVGGAFPFSTTGSRPVNGWSVNKNKIDELSGVKDWTFHDLRRTMRSHLSALPIEEHVREMMIGHRPIGIKKVYDRYLYVAEKRAGFELWEKRLRGILNPRPPAEVADITEARAARVGA
jgi:integrase